MTRLPHHIAMTAMLDKGQFEACRITAQQFIEQQMAAPDPDDQELAHLHLFLCRALLGVHENELAAEKADVAVFLAKKLKDESLVEEALYCAGNSCVRAAEYRTAIRRFTDCLACSGERWRARAYYGRGLSYDVLGAFSYATADYKSAVERLSPDEVHLGRKAQLNLAWVLILQKDFAGAEAILAHLENEDGANGEPLLRLQIAHDRIHMAHLKGDNNSAFVQAVVLLGQIGHDYPHIRAHVAVTLLGMAGHKDLGQHAFTFGVLAKRLAGSAKRPDLDEEASRAMQSLEFRTGTDCLVQSLCDTRQVLPGAVHGRRVARRRDSGGAG